MWRDTHPPQQGIEMVQEITELNSSHLDLPRACMSPKHLKLGRRLAGADVEEHRGRDEADDLAAKRAAKNTLRAKLVQE